MTNCVTLANIDAAVACQDLDNMGGIVPVLIFGYHDDVDVWPDFPAPSAAATSMSMETAAVLSGDVVMKEGTCAYQMEFTDETGEFSIQDQGETGGESFAYNLTIISAKMRKAIFGFENATRGRKMFFIVQDNNGNRYLMGDKRNGSKKVTSDGSTTGTKTSDRNQNTLKYLYNCPRKLMYAGDTENILTVTPSE